MNYTKQQIAFVDIYLDESRTNNNYSQVAKKAKEDAGYSENTSVSEIIKSVKELIIEGINLRLAQMAPKLINSLEACIDNPATPGVKNVIAAASTLLDRGGIIKKEESTLTVKAEQGVLILPAKTQENIEKE